MVQVQLSNVHSEEQTPISFILIIVYNFTVITMVLTQQLQHIEYLQSARNVVHICIFKSSQHPASCILG